MSLIDDAKAAKEAGMSYGIWKSLQPRANYKKKGHGMKVCANCGDVLIGGRVRFCCNDAEK